MADKQECSGRQVCGGSRSAAGQQVLCSIMYFVQHHTRQYFTIINTELKPRYEKDPNAKIL
jgi:hypothetical protein